MLPDHFFEASNCLRIYNTRMSTMYVKWIKGWAILPWIQVDFIILNENKEAGAVIYYKRIKKFLHMHLEFLKFYEAIFDSNYDDGSTLNLMEDSA